MVALFLLLLSAGAALGQIRVHSQRNVNRLNSQENEWSGSQGVGTPTYPREDSWLYGQEMVGVPVYADPSKYIDYSDYIEDGKEVTRNPDDFTRTEEQKMYRSLQYLKKGDSTCAPWDTIVDMKSLMFNLYTRDYLDGKGYLRMRLSKTGILEGLENSNFNKSNPTKIFIHGWEQTGTPPVMADIPTYSEVKYVVEAYMKKDVNLIMVDWSKHANCEYFYTIRYIVPDVGLYVSTMIKNLVLYGDASINDMHVIGFGLGAHVASYASKYLKSDTYELARITGVDPLGPGYYHINEHRPRRLSRSDAKFVDIIYSNQAGIGIRAELGHVEFFPNGGNAQPGCPVKMPLGSVCSHQRGLKLFAESVISKIGFWAVKCESYINFRARKCDGNDRVQMGELVSTNAMGKYYLQTHKKYPHAMGDMFGATEKMG